MNKIMQALENVLKILSGKLDGFYLAGGTPLSMYYFHHRESYDLDFFTKDFSKAKIEKIISILIDVLNVKPELAEEQNVKDKARYLIYTIKINKKEIYFKYFEVFLTNL